MLEAFDHGLDEWDQNAKWVHQYAYEVVTGKIVASQLIIKSCQRHIDDIKKAESDDYPYYFDEAEAQRFIDFCNKFLFHIKGELAGTPFLLPPWEIFLLGSIFGWRKKERSRYSKKKLRRFKTAECWVARKNGKSFIASAVMIWCLLFDSENGAEIYSAATTRDQARITADDAMRILRGSPLAQLCKVNKYHVEVPETHSVLRALSADGGSLDGLNVHLGVLDELHAHKQRDVYDVITTATGAREMPIIFVISTAGTILQGIGRERWSYSEKVITGLIEDETHFAVLYSIDKGDKYDDPSVWIKANPCLGISKKFEDMERLALQAGETPAARANYLTKHLNVFVSSAEAWLNITEVEQCEKPDLNIEDYKGRKCFIGLDLSSKHDLTALSLIFPENDGGVTIFQRHYLPEETLNKVPVHIREYYKNWSESGYLTLQDGNVIDHEWIKNDIRHYCKTFDVDAVGYDPYSATQLALDLYRENIPMVEVQQNIKNLSEPSKQLEALIKDKKFSFNGDKVFKWCCENAVVWMDVNENIKVRKDDPKQHEKIDSLIATITGLSIAVLEKSPEKSVYEDRGLLILGD